MNSLPLVKGVAIGLAVATPVGPMSLLCMRRTLTKGWRPGFTTGLGIATGDGVYAFVAALGLARVSRFMLAYNRPLHALAGVFLVYLGLRTFLIRVSSSDPVRERSITASDYLSALFLTLTNPPTIISFAAIFTVFAPASGLNAYASAETVLGVFIGSTLWWFALTTIVRTIRHVLGRRTIRCIDGVAGTLLSLFGIAEIRRAL